MENKEVSAQFFLSNLSHEIRTPLNGIFGYTQLLLKTKMDKTQKMYITSMNQCCVQLVELVNDILDFSKLTTGKAQINNECVSLKEIFDEVSSAIGYRIKEKRQKCRYTVGPDVPDYIITDKQKLVQIFINLVSNAIKFTPINGRIIVAVIAKSKGVIECSVEDNGIGISLEDQQKLFNPFIQVQESVTKNGSGLGLAISKRLVELLGGMISVESDKDHGAVFSFTIKYEPYEDFKNYVEQNSKNLKDKYVLLVDDNVDNRLFLSDLLFEYGMRPIICSSAKEAMRLVVGKRYPFSAGLLDICMPDIAGTDLAKQIKDIDQELPLIALSSLDEPFDSPHFDHILTKPVNKLKLLDTLSRTIQRGDVNRFQLNENDEKGKGDCIGKEKAVKILIAEDISYNSDMLSKMLNSLGYKGIDTVSDGEEAVKALDREAEKGYPYDILLLDLKMPKLDGFGVAAHIAKKGYEFPKITVVTASVLDADRDRCREMGIKYFLLKPFNMTHLKSVLNRILNGTGKQ